MSEYLDVFTGNVVIVNTQQMWVQTKETSALLSEKQSATHASYLD